MGITGKSRRVIAGVTVTLAAMALSAPAALAADTTPPTAPSNLRAHDVKQRTAFVDFTPSTDNVGVIGYCAFVNGEPISEMCVPPLYIQDSPAFIQGLKPGTQQTIALRARDAAGNLSAPASVTITTPILPAPRNLRVVSQQGGDVTLAWDPPANCGDPCANLGYWIFDGSRLETKHGSPALLEHQAAGTHTYRIMGSTSEMFGTGDDTALSASLTVNVAATADRTPPTTPTNYVMVGDPNDPDLTTLKWTQSTDNVTPQTAIEYDMFRIDPKTNQMYIFDYTFARGTGVFGPRRFSWIGPIRAADEAGNASAPTGFPGFGR